ncbi:MAG: carotenoid oxygenase family protein [Candidatus Hydrogenedentes bacterium]|nr:carotenoid oxygenase family protein [Candidatus Hydrogenedentota bacterium]
MTTDRAATADAEPNGYLTGPFSPVHREITAENLVVEGEIPADVAGSFVRNSPNPKFAPQGRYHWFDGDGMLHGVHIAGGKATYRNRFVRTAGLMEETEAGHALHTGILERPDYRKPGGPFKNTGNTDLHFHAGKFLALWWLCGDAHQVRLPDLETLGAFNFGGALARGISAHPKTDPRTGELIFFDYAMQPPFMYYGVADACGEIVHQTPIEMPGPRLQHDIAITEHYTLLFDMPMYWDPELLRQGKTKVVFNRDLPGRIGVIPRRGNGDTIRWFEAAPFYMYHTINAYEEGDEIVLVGCRIDNPIPESRENPLRRARLTFLELHPLLHRWRINLVTGTVKEESLDDVASEFPRTNDRLLGAAQRYSYNPRIAREPQLLFDGLIKYDTTTGASWTCDYGPRRWGGEAVFVPRAGATEEDAGYCMNFVYNGDDDSSELWILDAQDLPSGPLAKIGIPQRVPIGYHTCWVGQDEIDTQIFA